MTGAWGIYGPSQRWSRSPGRAWLVLKAPQGEAVQFDGPLLELRSEGQLRLDPRLNALGPDVLADELDEDEAIVRLRRFDRSRPIGEALLDQRAVAGIGNLWKAEVCFAVGVSPWRAVEDVTREELAALLAVARGRMGDAAKGGRRARPRTVYRQAGRPCPRCGGAIRSRGQGEANRTTYWCPACQR
jgi:endonuclease-8